MKNLLESYEWIFKRKKKWKYYNRLKIDYSPFDENNAWRFIEDYYKAGEKGRVFSPHISQVNIRPPHSISVFFLGILLKDIIIKNADEHEFDPDFRYLWFLTSLFHDYACILENDKKFAKRNNIADLKKMKEHFQINSENDILDNAFNGKFSLKLINSYSNYRIAEKKIDHGITGGLLLYKGLKDNYEAMYKERLEKHSSAKHEHFKHKGLLWSECQFDNFRRIAKAIIYHNIWFCYKGNDSLEKFKNNKKIYNDKGLSDLIIETEIDFEKKHRPTEDPFLFLLILSDTIEPIKHFEKENHYDVLSNITLENINNTIVITVSKKLIGLDKWFDKIEDLKNWTTIDVEKVSDRKLIISNY